MTKATITEEEFQLVRQNFEKKVVQGVDLYHKTTPDEWKDFMKLIEENGPFDIVVDGLNVAFKSNYGSTEQQIGRARANGNLVSNLVITLKCEMKKKIHYNFIFMQLIDAVKQLKQDGKRVLIIGRKHMEQWQGIQKLYRVTRNVFLVDNM